MEANKKGERGGEHSPSKFHLDLEALSPSSGT